MRARTHVPTKNTGGSKRPKLLDFSIEQISLICLQKLHPRRKITVSLLFGSPAYYLLRILMSYLSPCQSDFRKSVHYLHENKYEHQETFFPCVQFLLKNLHSSNLLLYCTTQYPPEMSTMSSVRKVLRKFTLFAPNHLLSSSKLANSYLKFPFLSICFVLQVSADPQITMQAWEDV